MGDRFVFVGNRRFVLERMLQDHLDLCAVFVVQGTHLQRDLEGGVLGNLANAVVIRDKADLLARLRTTEFDVLVSNGCPYILPVADLPKARYVNIHPSYLPDLRGADPAIGAVLFGRDAGATCHVMDAGIDTGPIIAQVRIPFSEDLDVTTLYQLSFVAEQQAFSQSLARDFKPAFEQTAHGDLMYYSRRKEDRIIDFTESNELLLRKVKAFNNRSAGCEFIAQGHRYRAFSARRMENPFLADFVSGFPALTAALSYENCIVFHKDGQVLRFEQIDSIDGAVISVGDRLG